MEQAFGQLIKEWRQVRRYSQLALSVESGLSSRHISFLETGRSKPSRGSVLTLARVLGMPRASTNEALLAAGFAPEYPALDLDDDALAPALSAIDIILKNHMPFPAIVIDAAWNIVGGNEAAQGLMQVLPMRGSFRLIDAILNDCPENPVITNWDVVATWTLLRLQAELSKSGKNGPVFDLYKQLASHPRLQNLDMTSFTEIGPVLTTQIKVDQQVLSLLTMLAEFSTVQDVTMSERRIELFFPADETTRMFFEIGEPKEK